MFSILPILSIPVYSVFSVFSVMKKEGIYDNSSPNARYRQGNLDRHHPMARRTINAWIADAIRDYSHFFPYVVEKSYTFIAAARSFTISSLAPPPLEVLRVEFPDGEEPPRYLSQLPMTSKLFWDGPYYEVRGVPPNEIYMGEEAAIGDVVVVRYNAIHTIPTADASVLTLPDRHLEVIRLFCIWKAAEEIAMSEEIDPDTQEFLVSQMGLNIIRCERIYRNKMQEYQRSSLSERAGPWSMEVTDRVY